VGLDWHKPVCTITAIFWFVFCLFSFVAPRPACVWSNSDLLASQSERPADSGAVYRHSTELYCREALITAAMTSTATSSGNITIKLQDLKIWLQA
jgi:hypothetical protein